MSLVITIPIYKPTLDHFEELSLKQLGKIIGKKYQIIFFGPEGLDVSYYKRFSDSLFEYRFLFFDRKYFTDLISYSKLCLNPIFYRSFANFDFVLIYQVDAFIFKDDLTDWCEKNYDYIGAPFFNHGPIATHNTYFGVGNGGFSLRKVDSMLRIITTNNKIYNRKDINRLKEGKNFKGKVYYELVYSLGYAGLLNTSNHRFTNYSGYEDFFWGYFVGPKLSWVRFPDYSEALRFSFEYSCERLYKDNKFELPTGCHAWLKEDTSFWKPHFHKLGIDIP